VLRVGPERFLLPRSSERGFDAVERVKGAMGRKKAKTSSPEVLA
jgi:hypothetical protein